MYWWSIRTASVAQTLRLPSALHHLPLDGLLPLSAHETTTRNENKCHETIRVRVFICFGLGRDSEKNEGEKKKVSLPAALADSVISFGDSAKVIRYAYWLSCLSTCLPTYLPYLDELSLGLNKGSDERKEERVRFAQREICFFFPFLLTVQGFLGVSVISSFLIFFYLGARVLGSN